MSEDLYSVWGDLVRRTASFVCRDYPDVEREDMQQELFIFILSNRGKLRYPDQVGAASALSKQAQFIAGQIRAQHLQLSAQYSYRTSDVRSILQTVFDRQDWSSVRIPDDARSEYNDVFLEINSDVSRAWKSLGHSQKVAIFEKYALNSPPEDAAARKRLQRAIEQLTDSLNWYRRQPDRDYVGTRRVITNAHSRANISGLTE